MMIYIKGLKRILYIFIFISLLLMSGGVQKNLLSDRMIFASSIIDYNEALNIADKSTISVTPVPTVTKASDITPAQASISNPEEMDLASNTASKSSVPAMEWIADSITEGNSESDGMMNPHSGSSLVSTQTPVIPSTATPIPGITSAPVDSLSSSTASTPTIASRENLTPAPTISPVPSPNASPNMAEKTEFTYPVMSFKDGTSDICLTFDDGGDKKSVERALDILKEYNVKCTFFVIGKFLKASPELWKRAIEEGHQICNHTQSHKWLASLKDDEVRKEISMWEEAARDVLGAEYVEKMKLEFSYIRLPGGSGHNSKRVLRIVGEMGYTPVGWNVESYYAVLRHHDLKTEPSAPIAEEVAAHIIKRTKSGSIVLLHFNPYDTLKLAQIIEGLKKQELNMRLLSDKGL